MSVQSDDYERGYYKGHGFPSDAKADLLRTDHPAAYLQGIRDALAGRPSTPPAQAPALPAPRAGTPPAAPPTGGGGVYVPAPVSNGAPGTIGDPASAYQQGYQVARSNPDLAKTELTRPGSSAYYRQGIEDGLAGRPATPPAGAVTYTPRRAPAYGSVPRIPAQGTTNYYEVLATSPIGRLPYDYAVGIERKPNQGFLLNVLQAAISFQVLGADPADWRDGYRLSGPNGAIAQRVQRLIREGVLSGSHAVPGFFGLDGWYGAMTHQGLRLLGKAELQALGLI